jgi:hypothetical protein
MQVVAMRAEAATRATMAKEGGDGDVVTRDKGRQRQGGSDDGSGRGSNNICISKTARLSCRYGEVWTSM